MATHENELRDRKASAPAFDHCRPGLHPVGDTDALRQRIDCTRLHMDETLDELQLRLTPRYMAEQAMNRIKESGRNTSHTVADSIRQNPLPAAMAGVGLAWLVYEALRSRRSHDSAHFAADRYHESQYESEPVQSGHRRMHGVADAASSVVGATMERVNSIAEKSQAAVESAKETASHALSSATHGLHEAGSAAAARLRSGAEHTRDALRHSTVAAREAGSKMYEEYPLASGGAMLALGIAAGLALPSTRREDEWMGAARDDLLDRSESRTLGLMTQGTRLGSV